MRFTHPHQFDGMADEIDLVIDYDYEPAEEMQPNPDLPGVGPGCAECATISSVMFNIKGRFSDVTDVIDQSFMEVLEDYCLMDHRSLSDEY